MPEVGCESGDRKGFWGGPKDLMREKSEKGHNIK